MPADTITVHTIAVYPGRQFWSVDLCYDPGDPYAAHLTFHQRGRVVPWVVARDLLAAGLRTATGVGDVRVGPAGGGKVAVTLSHDHDSVTVHLPRDVVRRYLDASYALVPRGRESEHIDLDAAVAQLVADGGYST